MTDTNGLSELIVERPRPVVFLSYSHDSQEHGDWVESLAGRLREIGIDVRLDRWALKPGSDLPAFMEKSLREAAHVLVICTENYVVRVNGQQGGVGYEFTMIRGAVMENQATEKFVPIIRQPNGLQARPDCLKTKMYIDMSDGKDFEEALQRLLEVILDQPRYVPPPLGPNPFAVPK